ncbi:MAG TPA: O-antigen ligase family protein, partial [Prolixibacteraceae bacterium]|nr:O-antigen ligase family protein [Prolixibacteraceae bacterium]
KDSAGVSQLTPTDIKAIERGIANHIYVNRSFSLYPRIYETIWEYDYYTRLGDPNHQSFSQRLEFVKASLLLIGKRPWLGIGTGNWKLAYAEAYHEMNSRLDPDNQGPSHNQYLNYLVKFGVVGFLAIMGVLLIPLFREGHRKNLVFWLFLVSIGFANFGDANLETHMGLSFFTFFYSLFLWHMPPSFRGALGEETVKKGGVSQVKEITG